MSNFRRVVVTGAPGTGKSTVLNLLEAKGYTVIPEMARQLIEEEQDRGSNLVPWEDHPAFGEELFARQVAQYHLADAPIVFYDRGIPDNLAYLRRDGLINEELELKSKDYPYHGDVFLMPPWLQIYGKDDVRWEDEDLMLDIDRALRVQYKGLGYRIVEVPKISPEQRMNFILKHLGLNE